MVGESLLINTFLLALGIILLVRSGIYVVHSLNAMARFMGVAQYTISFVLMAFATSLPELSVGINAAISGDSNLSLGNVLGTNIVNITFILGVVVLIAGKVILTDYADFVNTRVFNFLLIISPIVFLIDGTLSRFDGVVLLFFFLWNLSRILKLREKFLDRDITSIFKREPALKLGETKKSVRNFSKNLFIFSVGVTVLVGSSYLAVYSASNLSLAIGIPKLLIGILIIGLGTSLPELAFGIRSAMEGRGDMAFGNLLGAAVTNSTLVLGVTAVIRPVHVFESNIFWISAFFMAISMLLVYYFLRVKNFLVQREGLVLIFTYAVFILIQGFANIV
ncbi:MAG: sodium:calcium antiporter [Candidatus Spechtbacterales bacterium]